MFMSKSVLEEVTVETEFVPGFPTDISFLGKYLTKGFARLPNHKVSTECWQLFQLGEVRNDLQDLCSFLARVDPESRGVLVPAFFWQERNPKPILTMALLVRNRMSDFPALLVDMLFLEHVDRGAVFQMSVHEVTFHPIYSLVSAEEEFNHSLGTIFERRLRDLSFSWGIDLGGGNAAQQEFAADPMLLAMGESTTRDFAESFDSMLFDNTLARSLSPNLNMSPNLIDSDTSTYNYDNLDMGIQKMKSNSTTTSVTSSSCYHSTSSRYTSGDSEGSAPPVHEQIRSKVSKGRASKSAEEASNDIKKKYPADLYGSRQNVIVNYLPSTFSENDLRQLFLPYGILKHVKIARWPTGCSKEFGFVKFAKSSQAFRAITAVDGLWIDAKRLKVSLARKHCKEIRNTNLIVKNIPLDYDNVKLAALFSQFGSLVECRILRKKNHRRKLLDGMVRFDCSKNTMKAIRALNGCRLDDNNNSKSLEVRLMKKRRNVSRRMADEEPKGL